VTMFNPPHPDGIVAESVEDLALSINTAARALGIAPSTLSRVTLRNTQNNAVYYGDNQVELIPMIKTEYKGKFTTSRFSEFGDVFKDGVEK
jgi:IS30 family transposase